MKPPRTPSALLSRDPSQLSEALALPLERIRDVRAGVAEGVVNDRYAGHGGRAAELAAAVTDRCCAEEDGAEAAGENLRPPALMTGAVTALDMCARTLLLEGACSRRGGRNPSLGSIRTGSNAVDRLLAPDDAYSSFGVELRLQFPFKTSNDQFTSNNYAADNSPKGGVPFGVVTEFSGPPSSGKTQLALSVAAHAAIENELRVHYVSGGGSRKALSRRLFSMCTDLARRRRRSESTDVIAHRIEEEANFLALKALDRISVVSVPDAYSLLATLARIDHDEASRRGDGDATEGGTLLVVDSVSGCLGHHLSGEKVGAALANQVALTLRQMARTHDGRLGLGSSNAGKKSAKFLSQAFWPRRFAVVVTNGSVAKNPSESESLGTSKAAAGIPTQKNKPAMGRYWHVSDVGVWLEVDRSREGETRTIDFYHDSPAVGLFVGTDNIICATLQNHIGKSCKSGCDQSAQGRRQLFAKFQIGAGISDV